MLRQLMQEHKKKHIEKLLKELLKTRRMLKLRLKQKLPERNNLLLIKLQEKKNMKRHSLQLRQLLPLLLRSMRLLLEESYLQKLKRPRKRLSKNKLLLPLLHSKRELLFKLLNKRPSMKQTRELNRLLWRK
jgi:hypothetical protein